MEKMLEMIDGRGFVIRNHNLYDGETIFKGQKGFVSHEKEYFTMGDTYTFSGANKAVANLRRLSDEEYQYSIERLEECYFRFDERIVDHRKRVCETIEDAMKKLDELCAGNEFHNADKYRINCVRKAMRELKQELLR